MRRRGGAMLSAVLALAVTALLVVQVAGPWSQSKARPFPRTAATPHLQLGVTTLSLARNADRPWRTSDLEEVDRFEQDARRHADVVMWFADWAHSKTFDPHQAQAIAARGSVPEISWEPWDSSKKLGAPQPRYRLARIIDGDYDAYIRSWAKAIAVYGKPIRLRFAHEMNGRWYPWSERTNGNHRGEYTRAWRHVHAIFDAAGAKNVTWVWSPVAGDVPADEYPGSDVVDVIGVSGFNGGTQLFRGSWRSFGQAFVPTLEAVHALDPSKPVELSEVASTEAGGSKAAWIRDMFAEVRARPWIRTLVWFNLRKETDWRIESSAAAQRAFAEGVNRAAR